MFGVGTSEILIILLIALLVLGPEEIPKVARTLARTLRSIQQVTDEIKHTITAEINYEEERAKKIPGQESNKLAEGEKTPGADEGSPGS
ncbi:MAG: twin-arginine translocase TatA/TatE family subunit [Candidatus Methanosuratincola sp.]|jgi:sec-independent protein translocase protein TatB